MPIVFQRADRLTDLDDHVQLEQRHHDEGDRQQDSDGPCYRHATERGYSSAYSRPARVPT